MRKAHASGAGDEDYFAMILLDYEAEYEVPFTLRHCWKVLRKSLILMGSEVPNINLNVDVGDDEEDEVEELARPMGRDKAKGLKKKGVGSSGSSSSMNDKALTRLMVSELAMHNKRSMAMKEEERLAYLEMMAIDTNMTAPVNKMFFSLTTLNLARFLNKTAPQVEPPTEGQPSNAQALQDMEAWRHLDFLCHNYESLERKYKTEDAGTKKFVVARFLDYKMVDSKNVITQHKRKEISVEDLVVYLRIEEDNKLSQKNTYTPDSTKDNMVEHAGSSSKSDSKAKEKDKKKNDKKSKGKAEYLAPKAGIVKQKFQGTCYNCDQPGHRAANCKMLKRVNPRQANMVNDNVDMIAMVSDVIAMISEVNMVGSNNSGWWVDTGATRHMRVDKSMFHSFRAVDNGEKLYMGNSATAYIKGEGDVILKMTFDKELKLTNVLYVPEIRKNLYYCVHLLKSKDEVIDKFVLYKTEVKNQLGRKIKVVESDRGGEYVSPFVELCAKHEIRRIYCSLLTSAKRGKPLERLLIFYIRYLIRKKKRPLMNCGWEENYYTVVTSVGVSSQDIQKNAIMESRSASFFDNIFPFLTKETRSSSTLDDEVVQDKRQRDDNKLHDERQDQLEEKEVEPRRSKRARTEKSFRPNFVPFMVKNEPTSYREAVTSSEGHQWKEAIKSEIDSILQNHT
ncbi:retrotransposon protein, putative, ty1-copia subclass [Tanacetum coccineum]